jgi:hypothetical protein
VVTNDFHVILIRMILMLYFLTKVRFEAAAILSECVSFKLKPNSPKFVTNLLLSFSRQENVAKSSVLKGKFCYKIFT